MSKKWINIYTDKEERKLIDSLKVKYQLSLTTIVDILCEVTYDCLFLNTDKDIKEKVLNEHLYQRTNKTSIKQPRILNKYDLQYPGRFANNCLHLYISKQIAKYIKNADILNGKYGYWNRIEQELVKRTDNWWQYNTHLRMQRRMLRENKEYFKKALEETKWVKN